MSNGKNKALQLLHDQAKATAVALTNIEGVKATDVANALFHTILFRKKRKPSKRIEKEGKVSLQSKKALASAFGIHISNLEPQEKSKMKKYEYKTLEIQGKEGFLSGIKKQELPDFAGLLNAEGQNGWLLVQILSPELAQGVWSGKTGNLLALLQREVVE